MDNLRRRVESSIELNTGGRGKIGGYQYVDLNLPSGLLWATYNVGGRNETQFGRWYQWGAGSNKYTAGVNQYHQDGSDYKYTLPALYDTATQVMGSGWRMPTIDEIVELMLNTEVCHTENDDYSVTLKNAQNRYIMFPKDGYFDENQKQVFNKVISRIWSSQLLDENHIIFFEPCFGSSDPTLRLSYRPYAEGMHVRAVHDPI